MNDTNIPKYPVIPSFTWPVKGGDMSPIENIWAMMFRKLNKLKFKDLEKFWQAIQGVWCDSSDDKVPFMNLYNSQPTRMKAVHDATGYFTKN